MVSTEHRCTRCGRMALDRFYASVSDSYAVEYAFRFMDTEDAGYLCSACAEEVMAFIRPPAARFEHWELRADGVPFALANEEVGIDKCLGSLRRDPGAWRPSGSVTKVHVIRGQDASSEEVRI